MSSHISKQTIILFLLRARWTELAVACWDPEYQILSDYEA
jgi:hypothetical protein